MNDLTDLAPITGGVELRGSTLTVHGLPLGELLDLYAYLRRRLGETGQAGEQDLGDWMAQQSAGRISRLAGLALAQPAAEVTSRLTATEQAEVILEALRISLPRDEDAAKKLIARAETLGPTLEPIIETITERVTAMVTRVIARAMTDSGQDGGSPSSDSSDADSTPSA